MNADEMEAGRELDALVAEKVMGWSGPVIISNYPWQQYPPGEQKQVALVPHYSTDMAAAWEVETKIVESIKAVMELMDYGGPKDDFERYCCDFIKEDNPVEGETNWGAEGWADTAPLAICRAALKAIQK